MPGLLADVNVQGHLPYLVRLIHGIDVLDLLTDVGITFEIFPDRGLNSQMTDRALWNYCQAHELEGHLPVLTLANKAQFEHSASYATRVANDVANLLFSIFHENLRNQPRIFVPL
jgi:hypothetical protein